jgi:hypothetical protein
LLKPEAIYIYTDSTGFPRGSLVLPSETWPMLIADSSNVVYVRGRGGISIQELWSIFDWDTSYFSLDEEMTEQKAVVILSFGIVDFAPRPITYKLSKIRAVPFFGDSLWAKLAKFLHPHREKIQRRWHFQNVSDSEFERYLVFMIERVKNQNIKILLCLTPMPSEYVLDRSPGFRDAILRLNRLKRGVAERYANVEIVEIDIDSDKTGYVSREDGHHFSKVGHIAIARIIRRHIT